MKVLILGASERTSIGYQIGRKLRKLNHQVIIASRSGKLGYRCDVSKPSDTQDIVYQTKPQLIVLAAGCFPEPKPLGQIIDWSRIEQLLSCKTVGMMAVLDSAIRCHVDKIVVLGGTDVSGEPGFAHFSAANGALWSLVRFAARHTALKIYYLELGLVANSTMAKEYLAKTGSKVTKKELIPSTVITQAISDIIEGNYPSDIRITFNKGTT